MRMELLKALNAAMCRLVPPLAKVAITREHLLRPIRDSPDIRGFRWHDQECFCCALACEGLVGLDDNVEAFRVLLLWLPIRGPLSRLVNLEQAGRHGGESVISEANRRIPPAVLGSVSVGV